MACWSSTESEQDGIAQLESLARGFLPTILGLDFDETVITDGSSLSYCCGWRETHRRASTLK